MFKIDIDKAIPVKKLNKYLNGSSLNSAILIGYKDGYVSHVIQSSNIMQSLNNLNCIDFYSFQVINLPFLNNLYKGFYSFIKNHPLSFNYSEISQLFQSGNFSVNDYAIFVDKKLIKTALLYNDKEKVFDIPLWAVFESMNIVDDWSLKEDLVIYTIEGQQFTSDVYSFYQDHIDFGVIKNALKDYDSRFKTTINSIHSIKEENKVA